MDKVSVIVPAYNVEDYLDACIESLENQTYKNLEIIIVEDCSSDSTMKICRRLKEMYNNIKLLEHGENQGQEATREDGIAVSSGEWIMFLDSDDTYLLDGIERVMAVVESCNPDMVLCPYSTVIGNSSTPAPFNMADGVYSPQEICERIFTDLPLPFLSCIGSKAYKREFLIKNGIHFDKRFKYNEDGGYIYSSLMHAKKIAVADIPFYQYTTRSSGSIMSSYRENMYPTISAADHYLRDVLLHYECMTEDVGKNYIRKRAHTMMMALRNEAWYSSCSKFGDIADSIRHDPDFLQVYKASMKGKTGKAYFIMSVCLRYHMDILFYYVLKSRKRDR